jgi:hypothetical protein
MLRKFIILLLLLISVKVFGQAPVISSFSPASGPVGTLVTITGADLTGAIAITFGANTGIIVSNTGTKLVSMVMPGAATGSLVVSTPGGATTANGSFTVTQTPVPNSQTGGKLVGTGNTGAAQQGSSVAISADGSTAIVGAPQDNGGIGAAWVYSKSSSGWVQQGPKLVGTGYIFATANQGTSVALSADGNTAAVGAYQDSGTQGAVWIFTRANGVWTQQAKLIGTPTVGTSQQGYSVSLSADGSTLLSGAVQDHNLAGAAWVFTRNSSGVWSQQARLSGTDAVGAAAQGTSVALSADGNTAAIGASNDDVPVASGASGIGSIFVFTRSNGVWTQQGTKLKTGSTNIGSSIAITADGNTIISGGRYYSGAGASVFARANGVWSFKATILGSDEWNVDQYSYNKVSISADGATIVLASPADNYNQGNIWTFAKKGNSWLQQNSKFTAVGNTGAASVGQSVAISADGNVMVAGGDADNTKQGAAWIFTAGAVTETLDATQVTGTTATLNGTVSDNSNVTTVTMEYGTNADLSSSKSITPGTGLNPLPIGAGKITYSSVVTGLTPATTYYFRINGSNANTVSSGSIYSFTTVAGPPAISAVSLLSGPPGTLVTIDGSNLNNLSSLTVGGKSPLILSNTASKLTLMIMPGTTTGAISLSTAGGTATGSGNFTPTETFYPTVQQGNKIVGTGVSQNPNSNGGVRQGSALAISADGNTMVTTGPDDYPKGAVWVFIRSNGVWTQQAKLTDGTASAGYNVCVSADGNTITVGNVVYARSGTAWSVQATLKGVGSTNGNGCNLSADGNTALVVGYSADAPQGSVWIFSRRGGTWKQIGDKISGPGGTPSPGDLYLTTAISADGNTLALANPHENNYLGVVNMYSRNGDKWVSGGLLNFSGGTGTFNIRLGASMALSADGNVIIVSGVGDNNDTGAAWVFKRDNGVWAQQGSKLVGTGFGSALGVDFATQVTLSADGTVAMISADRDLSTYVYQYGGIWIFKQVNGQWLQQGAKLSTSATTNIKSGVLALSADGTTMVSGAPDDDYYAPGGVYAYTSATNKPFLGYITPTTAIAGTTVTITGLNLSGATSVQLAGGAAQSFTVNSPTSITAVVSASSIANFNGAFVTTPQGTSSTGPFYFVPVPTITVGGQVADKGTLSCSASYGFTYQWYNNGVALSGATNNSYVTDQSGTYTVSITLNGITQTSLPFNYVYRYTLPANTFRLSSTSATCKGSANGSITIGVTQNLNYIATITGGSTNISQAFNTTTTFNNLAGGTYNVCITIAGQPAYQQCFTVVVVEPKDITLYSTVSPDNKNITLALSGSDVYHIQLNGTLRTTKDSSVTLPLAAGRNDLVITTDKPCQGVINKTITATDIIIPYPDPFESVLYLSLGKQTVVKAVIEVYSSMGVQVYRGQFNNPDSTIRLDLSALQMPGAYSLKLTTDGTTRVLKIIKK